MNERDRSKPVFETPADTQVRFGKPPDGWRLAMHKVVFETEGLEWRDPPAEERAGLAME